MDVDQQFYRYDEAADLLGITRRAVQWHVHVGELRAVGARRAVLITGASIRQLLAWRHGLPEGTPVSGHVYLIRYKQHHKIGISKDVRTRFRGISSSLPAPAELIHTIPTNDLLQAEAIMHQRYADRRTNGEWFRLTAQNVRDICAGRGILIE